MPPKKTSSPPISTVEPDETSPPPEPIIETGAFFYESGAKYEGEFTMMYESGDLYIPTPQTPEEVVEDPKKKATPAKGGKKGKEEPEAEVEINTKPPFRVRHGHGTFTDGIYSFKGQFDRDLFHGFGTFSYGSGSKYEGEWDHGVYQGKGKYIWKNGTSYEGDWVANQMCGQGLYKDIEGHRWAGPFENNAGPGLINQL
mmetsp:Transcript_31316/g.43424  ORF Transcript_31316/g.43424 Transcript_31316/m.43424 type:complete len:199 (+) Transcript_31316:117-713(+)|eukprot:CAMPEP_0196574214 /NCGR_PEP_ID=MMETSP1081-20130531/3974_1 /TAXON_ID=36882 /ORGANISM="Pyramimonas amylifera, Strain CCMP720" /LENGTH=198 /DNA_ID=CAMNT_0041892167 /DNA_START=102 /DNA_END=698 /DNA_ORIENTATION=-